MLGLLDGLVEQGAGQPSLEPPDPSGAPDREAMMANPMKVMASTTPATMVIATKATPKKAMGIPAIMKSSSDQVRRVKGVSTMVRATSSSRELGSDPQVITMPARCLGPGGRQHPGTGVRRSAPGAPHRPFSQVKHRENWRSPEYGHPDSYPGGSPLPGLIRLVIEVYPAASDEAGASVPATE